MYKKQHIHFVGIGGIGMSGIAHVLLELGYTVSGSDLRENDATRRLERLGGRIWRGHEAGHVKGADVVVVSSAVKEDNPEIQAAIEAGIPVIPRAEMLAGLMRLKKYGIAVAGAHGKTSTTSMTASVLRAGGLDPTMIIGGMVKAFGTNACWGNGDFLVAEADESDGSFLRLCPCIAVVTNIDREHLDHYRDLQDIQKAFVEFLERIPFYGISILCGDDPILASDVLPRLPGRVMTYGTRPCLDLTAQGIAFDGMRSSYTAYLRDRPIGEIRLRVPGIHHVRNSLAALAVGLELDIPFSSIQKGLADYEGVGRRFEVLGEPQGILVVDDYAHHPTEIKATLAAARGCWPDRRIIALFEPHRYTRTSALMEEFATAFADADELWITEIYPASERPIVGVSGERLARRIREVGNRPVHYAPTCQDLLYEASVSLAPGDVVFTLGAGSIGALGPKLISLLNQRERATCVHP
ncbi:MAG: UDP-N-acetylmuramate--L-alanine ligase [Deltaproteobacteria bacterium]